MNLVDPLHLVSASQQVLQGKQVLKELSVAVP